MSWPILLLIAVLFAALLAIWQGYVRLKRADFIRTYTLPAGLYDKLRSRRPELNHKDCALVARGLRQFFLAYLKSGRRYVSMPSQVADELWHEFILYTRHYEQFCRGAFGGFLHHTPAVVLGPEQKQSNEGLRRTWWYACKEENVDPKKPVRLPLLFALDSKLSIAGGFLYHPDCTQLKVGAEGGVYCAGEFSSISVDGTVDGLGDGDGGDGGCGGD